jgi:2-C-methyl-D-erythritol 2,4-cyclodiphosphate synthase
LFRIGFGYDVHRLVTGRPLVLGGISIPFDFGLLGHSDADVVTHAVMDSILGALARGDIGTHFSDKDPAYKDLDSFIMLGKVVEWMKEDGFRINNLDITIVAERPRLAPHVDSMREKLSKALGVGDRGINIKATTTEGLGFCGRREGIEAFSIVSLVKQ